MNNQEQPGFEASLGELEAVVKQLESGDLPLEKALEPGRDIQAVGIDYFNAAIRRNRVLDGRDLPA